MVIIDVRYLHLQIWNSLAIDKRNSSQNIQNKIKIVRPVKIAYSSCKNFLKALEFIIVIQRKYLLKVSLIVLLIFEST